MGYVSEPPQHPQIAEAQEIINADIDAAILAPLKMISHNLKLLGTISQQEAFKLSYSELRGIITRALPQGPEARAKAKVEFSKRAKAEILENPAYEDFWFGIASGNDPLMEK